MPEVIRMLAVVLMETTTTRMRMRTRMRTRR